MNNYNTSIDTLNQYNKYIKLTNANIKCAVKLWTENTDQCETIYGHISNWNTFEVTDMSHLFENETSFNSDISN